MQIDRFGHAAIKVRDLGVTEAFYRDVLAFRVDARYPEDRELIFGFGKEGHLLVQAVGNDAPAPDAKTLGVHHVAFVVAGGERALDSVREVLAARGLPYRDVDHGDHRSVYLHDPDGHMLEIYHCPSESEARPAFTGAERLARARAFLFGNARLVDRAAYEVAFEHQDPARLRTALAAYRNADGGFGHALEPDLRTPTSQPLHVEAGLAILKEAGILERTMAQDCCAFLARVAAPDAALPAFLPGALEYPAAAHWQAGFGSVPSLERTCGAVALLTWHGVAHEWLDYAVERCRHYLANAEIGEAHYLSYAAQFAATVLHGDEQRAAFARVRTSLKGAAFYVEETPVTTYGLTPLHFAPRPDAAMRQFFDAHTIERHLDDLATSQRGDGGWTIRFEPPTPAAALEWRGRWTLEALHALHAYGRLR